ncbi:MAG: hypothetical protein VKO39_12815 [Cyanobacteriota bacterium]|nr:hypothetical protein [Cyanobacteriota bacterium]
MTPLEWPQLLPWTVCTSTGGGKGLWRVEAPTRAHAIGQALELAGRGAQLISCREGEEEEW